MKIHFSRTFSLYVGALRGEGNLRKFATVKGAACFKSIFFALLREKGPLFEAAASLFVKVYKWKEVGGTGWTRIINPCLTITDRPRETSFSHHHHFFAQSVVRTRHITLFAIRSPRGWLGANLITRPAPKMCRPLTDIMSWIRSKKFSCRCFCFLYCFSR